MPEKSTPKRVLILTTAYLPQVGGSELAIKNITDRLPKVHFDLITSRPSKNLSKYEKIGDVNVYRVGGSFGLFPFLLPKSFFPIAVFFKACGLIRFKGAYDIIHAYQASQAAGGGWLLKWKYPDTPFLLTIQEGKVLSNQPWLMRFFRHLIFKKADAVTVISNYLAEYVRSQNSRVPISVISNGVDLDKFKVKSEKLKVSDKNIVITVSRLVKKNGVGDLIDAMAVVRHEIPDAKLIIIGEGPLKESLKFKVKSLKLENKVKFLGEISYDLIPEYLAKADIFVRPSLSEGLGSAFLEAMAAELPVIGTSVGGIPDFLKDPSIHSGQATGLFCKVADPEDLAEKIIGILKDEQLRKKITANAKTLVAEKYDWNIIADKFAQIYERI